MAQHPAEYAANQETEKMHSIVDPSWAGLRMVVMVGIAKIKHKLPKYRCSLGPRPIRFLLAL